VLQHTQSLFHHRSREEEEEEGKHRKKETHNPRKMSAKAEMTTQELTAVLNGQRRYIDGWQIFKIKDQTRIIAEGDISIYPHDDNNLRWAGESTGPSGKPLQPGDRILVFNSIVEFKKT
jgi:hypothetical protein